MPNSSSSSSTQQRRAAAGAASYERASEPPIVRLMTPCLGSCALTYASARGVRTHKVNESLNTLHTAKKAATAQRLFAAEADRPNSGSRGTQQRRGGNGGGQLRASESPIVRLMTPCLDGCALFRSVTCAVLCHVHMCSALFVGCFLLWYLHTWSCM